MIMESIKSTYFSERKYKFEESFFIDKDVIKYWKEILGDNIFNDIEMTYDLDISTILFNENFVVRNVDVDFKYERLHKLVLKALKNNEKYNDTSIFRGEQLAFSNFFMPLINAGIRSIKENKYKFFNNEVLYSYSQVLLERLGKVSLGILIFEMYILKQEGNLIGNSPEEEYIFFNENYLSDYEYCEQIFRLYPCLLRCILETIFNLNEYYCTMLKNLEKDYSEIKKVFFRNEDFFDIKEIDIGISDSHKKGKVVSILRFDNGIKLVYKPRPLDVEKVYNNFLNKLSKGCKYPMFVMNIIDRCSHGWEQFIEFRNCKTKEELHRYFYRFGVLIFANYLLNTNDLHEENLVASGEYPIIVDLETILDNRRKGSNDSAKEEINNILHDSVLYSGLLPHLRFSNIGNGIDMSAIKGKSNEEYPIKIPKLKDTFTSNMRFEYENPVTSQNYNLIEYKGKSVNAYHFLDDINSGFEDAYLYVLSNKKIFLKYSDEFENLQVRHLVQDTQRYSMLLHTSFHPDFMQNGRDRQLFLCTLFQRYKELQGDVQVVKFEIQDMLNMDIPYFYLNTSELELYSSNGDRIENYFDDTSMNHFKCKIRNLSEEDLKAQQMYMDIVLTDIDEFQSNAERKEIPQVNTENFLYDSNKITLNAIFKLADTLIDRGVFNKDKTEVNWIGMTLVGDESNCSWDIKPLGTYLYEGMSGLSIFFNSLYKLSKVGRYKKVANAIDKELFMYTDEMIERTEGLEDESSGIFGGEASLVYTYELLYSITEDTKYLDYAIKHVEILKKAIIVDDNYDIIYGNAGAIIALLHLQTLTHNDEYLDIAVECGLRIVASQEKEGGWKGPNREVPLAGFSHGASGIIMALSKLWSKVRKEVFLDSIEKGLKFEESLFVEEYANWKDERIHNGEKASDTGSFTVAWCHGAAGILLSRVKLYQNLRNNKTSLEKMIKRDIDIAMNTVRKDGVLVNNCLCHGNFGNTEILREYLDIFDNDGVREHCDNLRYILAKNITKGRFDCDNAYLYGYELQGFMTGLSGVGYSLLRDIDKSFPCILSLEI